MRDQLELETHSRLRMDDLDPSILGYLAPVPLKRSNSLTVCRSRLNGRGVFAGEDIPAGSLLTWYPVRFHVRYPKSPEGWREASISVANPAGVPKLEKSTATLEELDEYLFEMPDQRDKAALVGFGNLPDDTRSPLLLGHMLNDGAGGILIPYRDAANMADLVPAVTEYMRVAREVNNCAFETVDGLYLAAARATRHIRRGEELTLSYGAMYWLPHFEAALERMSPAQRADLRDALSEFADYTEVE